MRVTARALTLATLVAAAVVSRPTIAQDRPTFRVNVDLVTTDVIVHDGRGQFIADLKPGELQVFEDGVRQDIASLVL